MMDDSLAWGRPRIQTDHNASTERALSHGDGRRLVLSPNGKSFAREIWTSRRGMSGRGPYDLRFEPLTFYIDSGGNLRRTPYHMHSLQTSRILLHPTWTIHPPNGWKQHRQIVTERAYIILHGFTAHTADNQGMSAWHPTFPSLFFLPVLFTVLSRFGVDFPSSFLSILNLTQFRQPQFGWVRRVFFSSPWKLCPLD